MKLSFVCLALIAVTLMSGVAHGAEVLVGNKLSAQMRARASLSANPRHQSHGGFSTQNVKALFEHKHKEEEVEVKKTSAAAVKKEKKDEEAAADAMNSRPPPELEGSVEMGGVSKRDLDSDKKKKELKKEIAESLGVREDQVQDVQVEAGSRRRRLLGGTRGAKVTYKVKGISEEEKSKAEANAKKPAFKEKMKKSAEAASGKTVTVKAVKAAPPPLPKNCGETMDFIAKHPDIPKKYKSMFHLADGKTTSSTCAFGANGASPGTCRDCVQIKITCASFIELVREHMSEQMRGKNIDFPLAPGKKKAISARAKIARSALTCRNFKKMYEKR
jgi:hypothetical protein